MDLADNWLGVPKLLTPEEIVNPNVDEMSMMTYLSQFPNAKVKENAPLRTKAQASKVRAHGPGLEATGNVAKAPAKFTVETFGAGDGDLNIAVKGPDGTDYKVDRTYNNDRKSHIHVHISRTKREHSQFQLPMQEEIYQNLHLMFRLKGLLAMLIKSQQQGQELNPKESLRISQPTLTSSQRGQERGNLKLLFSILMA